MENNINSSNIDDSSMNIINIDGTPYVNNSIGREKYFDIARGIGIILVLMGHTGFLSDGLKHLILSFHMPMFFVISGMLMAYKGENQKAIKDIFSRRVKSLMIPYLWFSLIYIVVYIFAFKAGDMSGTDLVQNIIYMVDLYGDSTLWFLPALILGELGFVFIKKRTDDILKNSKLNPDLATMVLILAIGILAYYFQLKITIIWSMNSNNLIITNIIDFIRGFLRAAIVMSFIGGGFYGFGPFYAKFISKKEEKNEGFESQTERYPANNEVVNTLVERDDCTENRKNDFESSVLSTRHTNKITRGIQTDFDNDAHGNNKTKGIETIGDIKEKASKIKGLGEITKLLITIVIAFAALYMTSMRNEIVDFHRVVLGNYLWFLVSAFAGTTCILSFSVILDQFCNFARFAFFKRIAGLVGNLLSFWGRNSLIIMCTHLNLYILYWSIRWAWFVDRIVKRAKSYVFMFNILLAALILESILIFVINRYLPFLIGRKRKH